MKIERIEPTASPTGRVRLVLEDGTKQMIYPSVVAEQNLYAGMELDEEALARLHAAAGAASARNRAVRIVSAADVSGQELRARLVQKGETPQDAEHAVQWLQELSLLDDRKAALRLSERCARKGYGPAKLRQLLYEKHIPKEYWEEALAQLPDMSETLVRFLAARLGSAPDERAVKKAVDALLRQGHSYGEIRKALARYREGAEELLEEE